MSAGLILQPISVYADEPAVDTPAIEQQDPDAPADDAEGKEEEPAADPEQDPEQDPDDETEKDAEETPDDESSEEPEDAADQEEDEEEPEDPDDVEAGKKLEEAKGLKLNKMALGATRGAGESTLPTLQNVRIEGEVMSWDSYPDASKYEVRSDDVKIFTGLTSMNLRNNFGGYLDKGEEYHIFVRAITTDDMNNNIYLTEYTEVVYRKVDITPPIIPPTEKIKNVSALSNISSILKVGAPKVDPTFKINDDLPISITTIQWLKFSSNGALEPFSGQYFEEGIYSVEIKAKITDEEYEFDPYVRCNIDDASWSYPGDFDNSNDRADTVSFTLMTPLDIREASELPEIPVVSIVGDELYWEPLYGMDDYIVYIDDVSDIFNAKNRPVNLAQLCKSLGVPFGTYEVKIEAIDFNSPTMESTSKMASAGMYTYGEKPQEPQKIVIKSATVQSNVNEILKVGGKAEDARLTSDVPQLYLTFSRWFKYNDDGPSYYGDETFTSGKYRFECMASLDPAYADKYAIDDSLKLIIDDKECEYYKTSTLEQSKVYFFYSPDYTVKGSSVEPAPVELPKLQNVTMSNGILSWDPVDGAEEYKLSIAGMVSYYSNPQINIQNYLRSCEYDYGNYSIIITAVDAGSNDISQPYEYYYEYTSEKTKISSASVTSNYSTISVYGGKVQLPTFDNVESEKIRIIPHEWSTAYTQHILVNGTNFEAGKYYYCVEVRPGDDYLDYYELGDDFVLYVNGQAWSTGKVRLGTHCYCYSPIIEVKDPTAPSEPVEKEKISSATANSNYQQILKIGEEIKEPSFEVEDNVPITIDGHWVKKGNDGIWQKANGNASAGGYVFEAEVRVKDGYTDTYELSKDFTLTVNGKNWDKLSGLGLDIDYLRFDSEYIELTAPVIEKTEITTVNVTSNMAEIFGYGKTKQALTFNVDGEDVNFNSVYWQKKVGDEWKVAYGLDGDTFDPGLYRYRVAVSAKENDHYLSDDFKLIVDGQEWTLFETFGKDTYGNLMGGFFHSPEVEIKDSTIVDPEPEPEPTPTPTPAPTPTPTPAPTPAPAGSNADASQGASTSSYTDDIPSGAITVSLPRTNAATAVATAGPSVLGANREAARAVTLKMSKLTDAQYKDAVIKNLSATPAGGLFRLETDRISCFDRAMLETFAKRSNVDMQVLFPLGSKKISITIPAGYDINKLLDKKGYCGFLRLLAILGGEIVTK